MGITMYKICNTCTKEKPFSDFSRSKSKRDGYQTQCKDCVKEYKKLNKRRIEDYQKRYREDNKDNALRYRENNKENIANKQKEYWKEYSRLKKLEIKLQQRKHRKANKEKISSQQKEYREKNKENIAKYMHEYQKNNRHIINAITSKRRACKLNATPKWLSKKDEQIIRRFYKLSILFSKIFNSTFHVDHIIPLQGKTVCGLHVPWNLQILPAKDNISKSNSFEN
jgi:Fe2+ transport system protein B